MPLLAFDEFEGGALGPLVAAAERGRERYRSSLGRRGTAGEALGRSAARARRSVAPTARSRSPEGASCPCATLSPRPPRSPSTRSIA
jgi:hypothetical protein